MYQYFQYFIIDPRPANREAMVTALTATDVLGIEVTIPGLALLCNQGNIDPQHDGTGRTTTAIEAALTAELPPEGTTLATIRPDLDSIGAMAVLRMRTVADRIDLRRVQLIADADRFANGPWHRGALDEAAINWELRGLGAIVGDFKIPVEYRVHAVITYLQGGDVSTEAIASAKAEWTKALEASVVSQLYDLAIVVSPHRFAMEIGYAVAPVVVASNPAMRIAGGEPHLKHTIAQWPGENKVNMAALLRELQGIEDGWGGNVAGGIIGSPQGIASTITTAELAKIVSRYMI